MAKIPTIELPASTNVVTVRVIDTTTRIKMPTGAMFDPPIKGHDMLDSPSFSFLIENQHLKRSILYDLGTDKKWRERVPSVLDMIESFSWNVNVDKDVSDILQEHQFPLDKVEAIIWGHWHWDHIGNPAIFPSSTDIIVGPGFHEEFFPGGSAIPDSPIPAVYYEDRKIREITVTEFNLKVGKFSAFDYFGDGSFYLLDSPGHAIGHCCGLARTTVNPDTFVLMGGDIASHAGEFRPSQYVPMPTLISPNPLDALSLSACPGHIFKKIHHKTRGDLPFYGIGTWPDGDSVADDLEAAVESNQKLQLLDAHPDQIFVVLAHDETIKDAIDLFPKTINSWREKGYAHKCRWMFLGDFKDALLTTS